MIKFCNRSLPTRSVFFCLAEDLLIWLAVVVSVLIFPFRESRFKWEGG
ncbi:MAG: hypothetical protein MPW17_19980 [Candidatus Manganitrophus sp.]|nr:hypothetical protein [Candidatus Manganitrophus sp.]WDT70996.1 MAG: hypothetical protein MPW17_19980 [Candidatus Manganitrophus sp.]